MKFQKIICLILFGYGVIFASIVNAKTNRSFPLDTTIWQNLNIPVCWEDINQNAFLRGQVKNAVESTWELNSQLDFTGWAQCPTGFFNGIRIGVEDTVDGAHTKGLGNILIDVQDGMVLNFAMKNWNVFCPVNHGKTNCVRWVAVHEFGHALGFAHEQNRIDTPTCDSPAQGTNGNVTFTEWDLDSIMNYCNPEYSGFGKLSSVDILTVQTYYGRIPTYSLARTLQIPVVQVGNTNYRISLSDIDGDGRYTLDTVSYTSNQSSKPAIYNNSVLELPLLRVVDEDNHVISLYSVQMQRHANGQFTISNASRIQPVSTSN